MKIGIIRERKQPSDQRVPLTPNQCAIIRERYPEVDLVVETSPDRCYADDEYREQGVTVTDDLSSCDVLMGVKEVPIDHLLAGKTYFFFSHTIKEQPYNRNLLRTVLERNIRLVDYETLTATTGQRLIGFGRYAGIVGAYNGVRAWGLRHGTFQLPKAVDCRDRQEMETGFDQVQLPAIKIALSGGGRVARGAMEVLDALQVPKVSPEAFLNEAFDGAVYTQLNVLDYNARLDGTPGVVQDFFTHPEAYRSDFFR
ncbi:MAG: alanine dehydrogenase, partial [Bacteroidota bacterium]